MHAFQLTVHAFQLTIHGFQLTMLACFSIDLLNIVDPPIQEQIRDPLKRILYC